MPAEDSNLDLFEDIHRALTSQGMRDSDVHFYLDWIKKRVDTEREGMDEAARQERRVWFLRAAGMGLLGLFGGFVLGAVVALLACDRAGMGGMIEGHHHHAGAALDRFPIKPSDRMKDVENDRAAEDDHRRPEADQLDKSPCEDHPGGVGSQIEKGPHQIAGDYP